MFNMVHNTESRISADETIKYLKFPVCILLLLLHSNQLKHQRAFIPLQPLNLPLKTKFSDFHTCTMLLLCMRCRLPAVNGPEEITPATQKPFIGKLPALWVYLAKSL